MTESQGPAVVDPARGSRPATLDLDGYLTDPGAELGRCAHAHWYADGLDMRGQPMPWVLGYDGVRGALRDRRLSPRSFPDDMRAQGLSLEVTDQFTPLFRRDGEAHRRHRALLSAAFTPRRVEKLRPVATAVADRLADGIAATDGRCVFLADFAAPLPTEVFAALFGLPAEDGDRLAEWAAVVVQAFQPAMTPEQIDAIEAAAAELHAYCTDLIAQRRAEPADDLTTHLLTVELEGERLDDEEIVATMSGFIFAGSETTKRQLAELVLAFVEHPEAWGRLAEDPDLIGGAVEEVLRHRPIVPALSRVAIEPFEQDDLTRAPGERLLVSFQTANHDDSVFADPDSFDIERANASEHVTFGWGPHFCLGAGLARVELQEALRSLVARFGPPTLVGDDQSAEHQMIGPDELFLAFPPR